MVLDVSLRHLRSCSFLCSDHVQPEDSPPALARPFILLELSRAAGFAGNPTCVRRRPEGPVRRLVDRLVTTILGPCLIHASANVTMCLNVAIQTAALTHSWFRWGFEYKPGKSRAFLDRVPILCYSYLWRRATLTILSTDGQEQCIRLPFFTNIHPPKLHGSYFRLAKCDFSLR